MYISKLGYWLSLIGLSIVSLVLGLMLIYKSDELIRSQAALEETTGRLAVTQEKLETTKLDLERKLSETVSAHYPTPQIPSNITNPGYTPDDSDLIGCDPVTGRNESIEFRWPANGLIDIYQLQIARDPRLTLMMYDKPIRPPDSLSPAFLYPPGMLEAGHYYYWRVRGLGYWLLPFIRSPWSEVRQFAVQPGFPVKKSVPFMGIPQLTPPNASINCPVESMGFSWTGFTGTTAYKLILSNDVEFKRIVFNTIVFNTSYVYPGTLEYQQDYYWQVAAVEPAPSEVGPIFTFETCPKPKSEIVESSLPQDEPDLLPWWGWLLLILGIVVSIFLSFWIYKIDKTY